jgi:cytochrome d ubiquinol oxidase subunit I
MLAPVTDLLAARAQMAVSLGFHIVFAVIGIAMPVLMVIAEVRWLRTGDRVYLELARRWARGTAVLFAVGAVSGTVLSFELGLLWPGFMELAGPIIGIPFSLEGFAFFVEAIFLGVYLYGWTRIPARAHVAAGVLVAVSGAVSGVFVVIVNAWMNAPAGFVLEGGRIAAVDPLAAMANPAAFSQTLHMTLAAYATTGLAVAGIHAWALRRDPRNAFHRNALKVALLVGGPAAILQPLSGDIAARVVARTQPAKFAAMEALFVTQRGAPLSIGGWPDPHAGETRFALEVPRALSWLTFRNGDAEIVGLDRVPRSDWPNVPVVHMSFQVMVALGTYMALVSIWALAVLARRRELAEHRRLLLALGLATPMGFVATEAGWMVTEVGRQPWVIQGVLRTADAVTPMPGLNVVFTVFTLLYVFLGVVVLVVLRRLIRHTATAPEQGR